MLLRWFALMFVFCLEASPVLSAGGSPASDHGRAGRLEQATLGGGCFWCMDAVFQQLRGVTKVTSGFAGGRVPNPTYEQVCRGDTGHAEVVQVTFDPNSLAYRDLLRVFFTVHDPTALNRQGADEGTQYRSAIFTQSPEQVRAVRQVLRELTSAHLFNKPIVTEVTPLEAFYAAEEHHQNYFAKNPDQPYCVFVVAPKIATFQKQFLDRLKR